MSKRKTIDLGALFKPGFYKALADPTRIALLAWLARQPSPRTVGEVANSGCCNVDLSVVSRHLGVLRDAGILDSARRGKEVLYRVHTEVLVDTLRGLADAIETCCPRVTFDDEEKKV